MTDIITTVGIPPPPKGAWLATTSKKLVIGAKFADSYLAIFVTGIFTLFISYQFLQAWPLVWDKILVGIAFLLIFWGGLFLVLWGKVEATFTPTTLKIFTGLGRIGFSKTVLLQDIEYIEDYHRWNGPDETLQVIRLRTLQGQKVDFANTLTEPLYAYFLSNLKALLEQYKKAPDLFLSYNLEEHLIEK